jgi:hypothetical protein
MRFETTAKVVIGDGSKFNYHTITIAKGPPTLNSVCISTNFALDEICNNLLLSVEMLLLWRYE